MRRDDGALADVIRFRVWEARAFSRRCTSSKAARAIGLVRAILPLGVWDARSGWRRGNARLVGVDGANALIDANEERVVLRIGAALHGVNANTLVDASNERVVLGIGAVPHGVRAGELLACLVFLDESS